MAEKEETKTPEEESKLSFKTADELSNFLMDLQGQIGNMQQTIDKLSPVEETPKEDEEGEEGKTPEEPSQDEISEIDKLLQEG